jgi:molybdopterin molybdotransferase
LATLDRRAAHPHDGGMGRPTIHQRIPVLIPLGEVLARIDAIVQPVAPRKLALTEAEGCVLAEDACVAAPVPAVPTLLRDGWAVRAEQVADASPYAPVVIAPPPAWLEAGEPMPTGTDAVLPIDAVMATHASIRAGGSEAQASATAGDGVLDTGADAMPERPLRHTGEQLRAADIALLRATGLSHVNVRTPRLLIAKRDDRPDNVAQMIDRALAARGMRTQFINTMRAFESADGDAVISIGGTGEGEHDETALALTIAGEIECHGIGISPGRTAGLGRAQGRPVLLLPGRIDDALAAFLVIGDAFLRRLTGARPLAPGTPVILARKIVSTVGLADVVPVRRVDGGVEPLASGHWPMQAIARADGWVMVPPESEGFAAGAQLEMRAFP